MAEDKEARMEDPDIKIIHHNAGRIDLPDDPSYPFLLDISLRPPEFMSVAFAFLHGGSETIRVRGKTRAALEKFAEENDLNTHPRLTKLEITPPKDAAEAPATQTP